MESPATGGVIILLADWSNPPNKASWRQPINARIMALHDPPSHVRKALRSEKYESWSGFSSAFFMSG
jgi:hypothetical protein